MHSDWLKLIKWLTTSNHGALYLSLINSEILLWDWLQIVYNMLAFTANRTEGLMKSIFKVHISLICTFDWYTQLSTIHTWLLYTFYSHTHLTGIYTCLLYTLDRYTNLTAIHIWVLNTLTAMLTANQIVSSIFSAPACVDRNPEKRFLSTRETFEPKRFKEHGTKCFKIIQKKCVIPWHLLPVKGLSLAQERLAPTFCDEFRPKNYSNKTMITKSENWIVSAGPRGGSLVSVSVAFTIKLTWVKLLAVKAA